MKGTRGPIEIDGGIRRIDGADHLHLTLREADGLRRHIADVVLTAEQVFSMVRGGTVTADGTKAAELDGGSELVDALDLATSVDGKPTDRSIAQIRDDVIDLLSGRARVPFNGVQALHRAMRGVDPARSQKRTDR